MRKQRCEIEISLLALKIPFCQERGAKSLDEFILFDWECTDYRDGWGGAVAWNELHLGQYVVEAAAGHMSNELLPNLDKIVRNETNAESI